MIRITLSLETPESIVGFCKDFFDIDKENVSKFVDTVNRILYINGYNVKAKAEMAGKGLHNGNKEKKHEFVMQQDHFWLEFCISNIITENSDSNLLFDFM